MTLKLLFKALTDYKLSMHCILNSVSLTSTGGINAHNATVIKAFVFSTEHANLLGYVPNLMLVILTFVGFVSVCCYHCPHLSDYSGLHVGEPQVSCQESNC